MRQVLFRLGRHRLGTHGRRHAERGLPPWRIACKQDVCVTRTERLLRLAAHAAFLDPVIGDHADHSQRTDDQETKLELAHD